MLSNLFIRRFLNSNDRRQATRFINRNRTQLSIDALECRITPALTVSIDGLSNLSIVGDSAADNIKLELVGTDIQISDLTAANITISGTIPGSAGDGTPVVTIPQSAFTNAILVNPSTGGANLGLDFTGGNPIPAAGLVYTGDTTDADTLHLISGTTTTLTHSFTNSTDGSVTLAGLIEGSITYTGIDGANAIQDDLTVTDRIFTFAGDAATATLADSAAPGPNMSLTSNVSPAVTFFDPVSTLTINGSANADLISIASLDGAYGGSITINGNAGNDSLNLDFTTPWALPSSLTYNAGADNGVLSLTNGSTTSITHTFANASDGSIALTGSLTGTINYTGLGGSVAITDSLAATTRTFAYNGAAAVATLEDATGANMKLSSSVNATVKFSNPTDQLTIDGSANADTINVTSVDTDGPFAANLTINGNGGDDIVNLNSSITFAINKNLDVNLQNDVPTPGVDAINVGAGAVLQFAGTGAVTLRASQKVTMAAGSALRVVDGNILIEGNTAVASSLAGTTPTSGPGFSGITLNGAALQSAGTGNITLTAFSGTGSSPASIPGGLITGGTTIDSDGSGAITIFGQALSTGSGSSTCQGLYILGATTRIRSATGAINITGHGGSGQGTASNDGIKLEAATIRSTGSATITITARASYAASNGLGGGSPLQANIGLNMLSSAVISSVNGDINVLAVGGIGTGNGSRGFLFASSSLIESTGSGNITITGIGGANISGGSQTRANRHGIEMSSATVRSSSTGSITMTGTTNDAGAAGAGVRYGWSVGDGSVVEATGSGNVTLYASSMVFGTSTATVFTSANGLLSVSGNQNTPGVVVSAINLGTFTTSTATQNLSITDANLDRFSAPSLRIGNANNGTITISNNITRPTATNVTLSVGGSGNIAFNNGFAINTAGGNLTLTNSGSGAITTASTTGTNAIANAVSLTAAGVGNVIGTNSNPLRITASSLTTNTSTGNGNQFLFTNGTSTLSTSSAGTGTISLNGGQFYVGNGQSVTATTVNVNNSATLGGTGSVIGGVAVNTGGIITGGTDGGVGTLTVGSLAFNGGLYKADILDDTSDTLVATTSVNLNTATAGDMTLNATGTTSSGTVYTLIDNQSNDPILNPPFTSVAELSTTTVNGKTGTYSYVSGTGSNNLTLTIESAGNTATQLVVDQEPAGSTVYGNAVTFIVSARTAGNVTDTTYVGSATISLTGGTFLPGETLTQPFVNGVATFSVLINVGSNLQLTATSAPLTQAVSTLFTVTAPAPAISSLAPTFGTVTGGSTVTITGSGFTGATAVMFGGNAASFVVDSDTQITATTPAGSGVVNVSVTTPSGTSANTAADDFTYVTKLTNVVIGDGTGQRSTIRSITLTFNGNIDVGGVGAGSISITNQSDVVIPGLNINVAGAGTNTLVLTFSDTNPNDSVNNFNPPNYGTPASTGPVTFGSLVDGLYRLKLNGATLLSGGVAVDIDANGTAGGTRNDDFHRLFGDKDGDQTVGTFDYFPSLINAINKELGEPGYDAAWDYDNDDVIGTFDFFPHLVNRFNAEIF